MKKILLGLGTIATVVTPVVAVVACGSTHDDGNAGGKDGKGGDEGGIKPDGNGFTDGTEKKTEEVKAIENLLSGSIGSYEAWALNSADIAMAITNTKTVGILKNIDFSSAPGNVIAKDAKPFKTYKLNKADIIKSEGDVSGDSFNKLATTIKADLDDSKMYTASIKTIKADKLPDNDGSFEIKVYEKAKNEDLMQNAIDSFNDPSKFAFDDKRIEEIHGTYTYGMHHGFGLSDIFDDSITLKGTHKDRMVQNNMKSWTMFGPVDTTKEVTKKSFTDGNKSISLNHVYYSKDKKTGKFNLVLNIEEKENGKVIDTQTIYIENDALTTFAKIPFDADEFKSIMVKYLSFTPVYNFFSELKHSAGKLDASLAPIKDLIMTGSSKINMLAKAYKFVNTSTFMDGFITYLGTGEVYKSNMLQGVKDYKEMTDSKDNYFEYGAHAWNGIQWANEFLNKLSEYIAQEVNAKHQVLASVENAAALDAILKLQTQKAKIVAEDKAYLDGKKVSYADMTEDDIIALSDKTKADEYAALVNALSTDVISEKNKLASLSDTENKGGLFGSHTLVSNRTKELLDFLDAKWTLIFKDDSAKKGIVQGLGANQGKINFADLKQTYITGKSKLKSPAAQEVVNQILGLMQKSDADKLATAIFKPLGFVA